MDNIEQPSLSRQEETITEQQPATQTKRRTAVRSPLLFPAYDFGEACRIAEKVETAGAGKLEESTLAIALNMSVKSSGFLLRALTGRQFKLIQKRGALLETTSLAKAIFKPVNNEEKHHAMRESFLSIPLFNAIAARFKGQPLPVGEVFRNILERELRIPHSRVAAAERVFLDSSREAEILTTSGNKTYFAPSMDTTIPPVSEKEPPIDEGNGERDEGREDEGSSSSKGHNIPPSSGGLLTISALDLAEFEPKEFDEVWSAIGKIVMKRGKRQLEQENKEK